MIMTTSDKPKRSSVEIQAELTRVQNNYGDFIAPYIREDRLPPASMAGSVLGYATQIETLQTELTEALEREANEAQNQETSS
jgi:hypothetical protein